jgi:Zn-dependent protease
MIIFTIWNQYSFDPLKAIVIIFGFMIGILSAISIHEFAHAWMAHRLGDNTAKHLGRLTLNPLAHIDPAGLFLFVIAGFGYSKPVEYNPHALKNESDEVKIAIAGPISNILLALIVAIPYRIATVSGIDISQNVIFIFLDMLVYMNIVLAVFNIIPIPPLDGSKIINYFLDADARESWERIGPFVLMILIFTGIMYRGGAYDILGRIMTPLIHIVSLLVRGVPQIL